MNKTNNMKEFLREVWEALTIPLANDFVDWLLLSLIWVCFILIVVVIVWAIVEILEIIFSKRFDGYGFVLSKVYRPRRTSSTIEYNVLLKIPMLKTVSHAEAYVVILKVEDREVEHCISREEYMRVKAGANIPITYSKGILFGQIFILKAEIT